MEARSGFSGASGPAGQVDVGWGRGSFYVGGRFSAVADGLGCCEATEGDRVDGALVLGLRRVTRSLALSLGAGPALARGQGIGGRGWGVGLEARLAAGRDRVGPALSAFANLNSRGSFFGLTLGVRFGGR